jgi:hypothetical protein
MGGPGDSVPWKKNAMEGFSSRRIPIGGYGADPREYYSEETVNLRIPVVEVITILL